MRFIGGDGDSGQIMQLYHLCNTLMIDIPRVWRTLVSHTFETLIISSRFDTFEIRLSNAIYYFYG